MTFSDLPKTYFDLVSLEPPRAIVDRAHYDRVFAIVRAMAGHEMTKDQSDYLETLQMMVERWEDENCEIGKKETTKAILIFGKTQICSIHASMDNPHKVGTFVKKILRKGRMNPGKHYWVTDGKGDFWEVPQENALVAGRDDRCEQPEGSEAPKITYEAMEEGLKTILSHAGSAIECVDEPGKTYLREICEIVDHIHGEDTSEEGTP